ncbi:MAG: hypothetical protein JSV24_09575 [Bacteroidales bacterium]|nr:MAG: hypothetical protein JSV24_09575 [Bacteroidales bacterium]
MKRTCQVFILLFVLIIGATAANLNQYLPKSINGWIASGLDVYYYPETLRKYIKGRADLFISYGFEQILSRRYKRSGQPDILVEIFDMIEPKNAFGVFTHARENIDESYGQGCQLLDGAILFWKDRYYVSIVSVAETSETKKTLPKMAKKISKEIKEEGELPEILQWLPEKDLIPESVFFFHHYIWANAFYFISDDNLLNIDDETDAVLAMYGPAESRYYLLIIRYPTDSKAEEALGNFADRYAPEIKNTPVLIVEDEKWTGAILDHELFICVLNGPDKKSVGTLLEGVMLKHSGGPE